MISLRLGTFSLKLEIMKPEDKEIQLLKSKLTTLLIGLGGRSSIQDLGSAYYENFGEFIDLKVKFLHIYLSVKT